MIRRVFAAAIGGLLVVACASRGTTTGSAAPPGAVSSAGGLVSPATPRLPAISSPAPAFSSPVDIGSETPQPLPTPVFGSEGTLPPLPSGGRSLGSAGPDDSVWAAQNVIDVFASEVSAVSQHDPNYCDVAIDPLHDGLTVWWHGTASAAVLEVMHRARLARINGVVLPAMFGRQELNVAMGKLDAQPMQKLGITETSLAVDCSGVEIGLATVTPEAEAAIRAMVDPSVPLLFKQMAPAVAL